MPIEFNIILVDYEYFAHTRSPIFVGSGLSAVLLHIGALGI